jgi:preprotein translocase SecE subunit
LQEFDTFWHEDAIRMDSLDLLKQYAVDCKALICASETLSYKWGFKDYLQTGVAGVAMLDLSWCGGLTEARKIAWPTLPDTVRMTIMVLIMTTLLSVFFLGIDQILGRTVKFLLSLAA